MNAILRRAMRASDMAAPGPDGLRAAMAVQDVCRAIGRGDLDDARRAADAAVAWSRSSWN